MTVDPRQLGVGSQRRRELVEVTMVLAAPSGAVAFEAEERALQILLGVGLLVVGLFVLHALGTWLANRDPQPQLAARNRSPS